MGLRRMWFTLADWLGFANARSPFDRARSLLNQGRIEDAIFACRDALYATLVALGRAASVAMPTGNQDERMYALNDTMAELGVYAEPLYRQIQSWLRIIDAALQGATDEFTIGDVRAMIDQIANFVRVVDVSLENAPPPRTPETVTPPSPWQSSGSRAFPSQEYPVISAPQRVARRPDPVQMPPSTPRQLPPSNIPLIFDQGQPPAAIGSMPRVPGFVGRGHVVMRLATQLRQGRHVAVVPLDAGTAGMGNSAIVSETLWVLAQDNPPSFPEGILALNCYGRTGEEGLRWLYNEIALTWHVPAIAQATSLPNQEREIRKIFLGRKVLIALDGVEMGLPIPRIVDTFASCGAIVVVTSRNVPRAEQLSVLRVDPLVAGPALTLFLERYTAAGGVAPAPEDEEGARGICELLSYRPLALEMAAAVAALQNIALATLYQRILGARQRGLLINQNDPNQPLRYLLDLALNTLALPMLNRFAALAIFAGPTWSEEAALAVLEAVEQDDGMRAGEALNILVRANLVQAVYSTTSGTRYRMPPYVRAASTRELLDRPVVMERAGRAMAAHYAGLALARRKVTDDEIMREEYVHMEAGLQWSHAHAEAETVVSYGVGLYRFWQRQGLWQEGTRYLNWAMQAAHDVIDRPREALLARELAIIEQNQGHTDRAHQLHERALEIWQALGNGRNEAMTLFELGRLAQDGDDLASARTYYDASLRVAREVQDTQAMARSLQALGLIFEAQGDLEEARRCYELVFEMRQEAHDAVGMAGALNVLGVLEYRLGRYAAARDLLNASLNCAIDASNGFWEAEARFWLGETALALRQPVEAQQQWQRALALYIRQGRQRDADETQRRLERIV